MPNEFDKANEQVRIIYETMQDIEEIADNLDIKLYSLKTKTEDILNNLKEIKKYE